MLQIKEYKKELKSIFNTLLPNLSRRSFQYHLDKFLDVINDSDYNDETIESLKNKFETYLRITYNIQN